jgi:hypothetical protein
MDAEAATYAEGEGAQVSLSAATKIDTLDKALRLADDVAYVRERWGKQAKFNYTDNQMADTIIMLRGVGSQFDTLTLEKAELASKYAESEAARALLREELTKANRQLAAANARAARRPKEALQGTAGMVEE